MREGSFACQDTPDQIDLVEIVDQATLIFQVSWKQTAKEVVILPSCFSNKELRVNNPYLLLDYYESKMRPCVI